MVSHILQMIIRCIWNVYLFSCLFATCESQFGRIKNQFGKVKTQFGEIKNELGSMKNGLLSNSLLKAREFYCCLITSGGANWLTYSHVVILMTIWLFWWDRHTGPSLPPFHKFGSPLKSFSMFQMICGPVSWRSYNTAGQFLDVFCIFDLRGL